MSILLTMANQKLKDKKKKTRERKNKVHVQKRRDAKHREDKKKKEWEEQMERDSTPEKLKPFVRPEKLKKREEKRDAEIKLQLDRNIKILQALEEQYLKEQQHKTDLGAELAAEGFNTIEEKLDILNKRAQEQVEE
jgi:hypothetical protein